ncbi:MAG: hypothetical protein CM15mP127_02550 [Gammaproteobacteria bacterium]|nr:MAG: hypothetical protein CM15mP127_02550 [Gammaproteobacteria bacterium]
MKLFLKAKGSNKSAPISKGCCKNVNVFNAVKKKKIQDLAAVYNINSSNLENTIQQYNGFASASSSCNLGKSAEDIVELNAPYYIMDISIDSRLSPLPTLTLGGLLLNEETGNVKNIKGEESTVYMLLEDQLLVFVRIYMSQDYQ